MSEKEELHIPFCIPTARLSGDQLLEVHSLLVSKGKGFELFGDTTLIGERYYYGVDVDHEIINWDNVEDYRFGYEDIGTEVIVRVYTYEELMSILKPTETTEDEGDTQVLESTESVSEAIVEPLKATKEDGVILNLSLDITLGGNTYTATRDEAFKLYEDLKHVFEERIV